MKDPIDFHIRSLEQRIDDLTEENAALTEQNAKLKEWKKLHEDSSYGGILNQLQKSEEDNKRLREALVSAKLFIESQNYNYKSEYTKGTLQTIGSALHSDHPKS